MSIQSKLFELADLKYADFISSLSPTLPREQFIGVRVPQLRKLAKSLRQDPERDEFLQRLPHKYYDENLLHALLISDFKEIEACYLAIETFLPYVDNWAVCDSISPKVLVKDKSKLLEKIKLWSSSSHTFTARFGLRMLMNHFLDEDFRPEYLEIPASIRADEYYLKMMLAWFFAEALIKQWETSIPYLEQERLDPWIHRKTIQKARESTRLTDEQKFLLKNLRTLEKEETSERK